jgi:PKD repeat protein
MKLKPKCIMLFLIIALATALAAVKPASSAATKLIFDPPIVHMLSGETVKVNITVEDATFLYSWQVNMSFDPTVLEFVNVTEGEFLMQQPEGTSPALRKDHAADGWILCGWFTLGSYQGIPGSGTLATVEFNVLKEGESEIKFETEPIWSDDNGNGIVDEGELLYMTYLISQSSPYPPAEFENIKFTAEDGFFFNLEVPPKAEFAYSPIAPGIGETITFDASASSATQPRSIIEYHWDFGDGTNATGEIVNHNFTTGGIYTVSLTVVDDAPATALIEDAFNTTTMPWIWYELYSTETTDIGVAFLHDIAVTSVGASKDEVTVGETVSINVTVRNNGVGAESFNVTAYYGDNAIEKKPVIAMSNGTEQTLSFEWNTAGVPEGAYQISAEATDVKGDGVPGNNKKIDGTVKVLAGSQFPTTLVVGAVLIVVVLAVVLFWLLRKRGSSTA